MKLIEFDGLEFKIADEALLVRPIRELFQKDKSKKKEEFWKQISYLWFMCDPRRRGEGEGGEDTGRTG